MIRFNNDYNHAGHPAVIEAIANTNSQAFPGYGLDECCERAAAAIKRHLDCPKAQVHFLVGGTQANYTVISAALRPWQSALAADTGHINVHETGAVEHIGHKVETLPNTDGKISAAQVEAYLSTYSESPVPEHITQPKMLYISFTTETGTIYSKAELEALRDACSRFGVYVFVDGARMGYGLGAEGNDLTLADFARLTDVFTIGGTKCGAMFGEAVIITNDELARDFRPNIKQNGGMLAKGWLLGAQFEALFENGLYFDITKRADDFAMRIRDAFAQAGVPFHAASPSNQQFVVLTDQQRDQLAREFIFEPEGELADGRHIARFCTSWSTTEEEVAALEAAIAKL